MAETRDPWRMLAIAGVAVLVGLGPVLAYRNFLLYHFYVQGTFFWDAGGYAASIWHRDPWLVRPPAFIGISLHAAHMMPLYSLLTELSWHLPLNEAEFFAVILAIGHALPALGVYWLLVAGLRLRRVSSVAGAALIAFVFAFNGLALAIIRYPHTEILLVGGAILFLAALALERRRLAMGFLIFTLLVREDAGLHIFALLAVMIVVNLRRGRNWQEQHFPAALALAGFTYSVAALIVQWLLFHGANSSLLITYTGYPPFHDFSLRVVGLHFLFLFKYRLYLLLPAAVAICWACRTRDPLIVVGYIAFLPWFVLQLIATSWIAGTLSGHYPFPFMIAAFWPLAAVIIDARQRRVTPDRRAALIGFGAMLAASFFGVSYQWPSNPPIDLWRGFTTWPSSMREAATDRAVATLAEAQATPGTPLIGDLAIDESITSLAPFAFPLKVETPSPHVHLDTIAYFAHGGDRAIGRYPIVSHKDFTHHYRFTGTSILLDSDRDVSRLRGIEPIPSE